MQITVDVTYALSVIGTLIGCTIFLMMQMRWVRKDVCAAIRENRQRLEKVDEKTDRLRLDFERCKTAGTILHKIHGEEQK